MSPKPIGKARSILVTGGSGFIGTHLCRSLIAEGHSVKVLDLRDPENRVKGVAYTRGDVRDVALLDSLLQDIDTVYHFAAIVSVPLCQGDPAESYSVNFGATLALLEAIRRAKAPGSSVIRLVFASTAAVYGSKGDDLRSLREEDIAETFSSYYAAQKHASEQAIALYRSCHDIPATVFRFFNVFGQGQDPKSPYSGVITILSELARAGKPLTVNGDGSQTRDFISVQDIVTACKAALPLTDEAWTASPMNLGTGASITVNQLAEQIRTAAGTASVITHLPPRPGDVLHSRADVTRAREALGFSASDTLGPFLQTLFK